jgi:hypothetical protein
MEKDLKSRKKEEAMDPIKTDDEEKREIIRTAGVMHSGRTYQYKINSKKREVSK